MGTSRAFQYDSYGRDNFQDHTPRSWEGWLTNEEQVRIALRYILQPIVGNSYEKEENKIRLNEVENIRQFIKDYLIKENFYIPYLSNSKEKSEEFINALRVDVKETYKDEFLLKHEVSVEYKTFTEQVSFYSSK